MTPGDLARRLRRAARGRVELDFPLAGLTTYRLGGPASLFLEPLDLDDLAAAAAVLGDDPNREQAPVLPLGRGSNLVVSDEGWRGIVVRLGEGFARIAGSDGDAHMRAGGGTSLPVLSNWAARRGYAGMEFAVGVPGSVGGAVRMNAGAHEGEIADTLVEASVFRLDALTLERRPARDLDLAYRTSNLSDAELVVDASFRLRRASEPSVRARTDAYRRYRAATQPPAVQNAGSVFKNPPGVSAGRLVDAAGLKGFTVGGASVSELHANFFIAGASATSQDVFDLVHAVRLRVAERFGVVLEPEIRFAGRFEAKSSFVVERAP